jgi:hypothetical protein
MTEEKPEAPATAEAETDTEDKFFIEVRGQKVEISRSSPEQLAMMRITGNRLARLNPDTITPDEVIRAYEKVVQVVTALPVSREDRDWFEDLLVSKEMDLDEASKVMDLAAQAWAAAGNRETRRAAKTTRRKPVAARK